MTRRAPLVATSLLLSLPACGDDGTDPAATTTGDTTAPIPSTTTPLPAPTSTAPADTGTDAPDPTTGAPDPTTGSSSETDPAAATCPELPPLATSALEFTGDDHIVMGPDPDLGLDDFTLAAWVRRDGPGKAASTGVGGLKIVPLIAKGRGESDGSNVDCNYAFGFVGEVLGADFEDMASGANHPVIGRTAIPRGEWHHVAATYDGTTWRLYVDGALDGEARAGATPRADSIQHFAIGTAMNSTGLAAGRFHGAIDEVRVWSRARSEAELAGSMRSALTSGEGLVGRWALDASDMDARDSVGSLDGTVVGASFVMPGAVLGAGAPPAVTVVAPVDEATVTGVRTELAVTLTDADTSRLQVSFHLRELTEEDDFTIVVLPDTQYYTVEGNDDERYFYDQTQWIVDNRDAYRIVAVIHNGDVVDHGDRFAREWTVADRAMSTLETELEGLPDGIPYGVAVGNHDQTPNGTPGNTRSFNEHFGVDRFLGRAYYGGHYGELNDQSWVTFSAGGLDFVVISVEYDTTQDPAVMAWARRVLESHPDAFGIVNSHYILGGTGNFGAQGRAIYDSLRDVDNLQLLTCGHIAGESRRTDTFEGNTVHSMLADYQGRAESGSGWMRIWELSPANDELTVRTYSPTLDRWETDEGSEFTLPVDLSGAGGDFAVLATVDPAVGEARAVVEALSPGRLYEWYATVSDCAHTTRTAVHRFRTAP